MDSFCEGRLATGSESRTGVALSALKGLVVGAFSQGFAAGLMSFAPLVQGWELGSGLAELAPPGEAKARYRDWPGMGGLRVGRWHGKVRGQGASRLRTATARRRRAGAVQDAGARFVSGSECIAPGVWFGFSGLAK